MMILSMGHGKFDTILLLLRDQDSHAPLRDDRHGDILECGGPRRVQQRVSDRQGLASLGEIWSKLAFKR